MLSGLEKKLIIPHVLLNVPDLAHKQREREREGETGRAKPLCSQSIINLHPPALCSQSHISTENQASHQHISSWDRGESLNSSCLLLPLTQFRGCCVGLLPHAISQEQRKVWGAVASLPQVPLLLPLHKPSLGIARSYTKSFPPSWLFFMWIISIAQLTCWSLRQWGGIIM